MGCAAVPKTTTKESIIKSDMPEKGKAWLMTLSESDKLLGLLILFGVIGGAAAFYFRDAKLLGMPLFCAAGCFFLKFLITAGDILAYVCMVGMVLILVFHSRKYWRAVVQMVKGGEELKIDNKEAYGAFKVAQDKKQTKATEKIVAELKIGSKEKNQWQV